MHDIMKKAKEISQNNKKKGIQISGSSLVCNFRMLEVATFICLNNSMQV